MRRSSAEDVWGSETTPHEALMTAHVTVPVSTLRECRGGGRRGAEGLRELSGLLTEVLEEKLLKEKQPMDFIYIYIKSKTHP